MNQYEVSMLNINTSALVRQCSVFVKKSTFFFFLAFKDVQSRYPVFDEKHEAEFWR